MSQTHLILISIGPVQDFIASARKLRDLWFGSTVLSELSKTVARSLQQNGAELIFPAPLDPQELATDSELNVANKILASVENKDPRQMLEAAQSAWREALQETGQTTLKTLDSKFKNVKIDRQRFEQQLKDIGEFFGVFLPYNDTDYAAARGEIEQLLAGRKNLRGFDAPSWDGFGIPKNSLDGVRECVLQEPIREIPGLLKQGERLDAAGVIKRFYPWHNRSKVRKFHDLANISLVPWKRAITGAGLEHDYNRFYQALDAEAGDHRYDEFWYLEDEDLNIMDETGNARNARRNLVKKIGEPHKYAAILVGDGDKMGEALDAITTAEGHRVFSRGLAEFANSMQQVVQQYDGELIYSGGDDVMAYLPLDTLLEGCDAIRRAFSEAMKNIFKSPELAGIADKISLPTFSIGSAIVHHSEPLDRALQLARKAEGLAKEKGGRNALALILSKRSGADLTIAGKWDGTETQPAGPVERLSGMVKMYLAQDKTLSATLGYQLREAANSGGDEMKFDISADEITAENATAALVLKIFKQKENNQQLKLLLNGATSVRRLSDELVIAKNLSGAAALSQKCTEEAK